MTTLESTKAPEDVPVDGGYVRLRRRSDPLLPRPRRRHALDDASHSRVYSKEVRKVVNPIPPEDVPVHGDHVGLWHRSDPLPRRCRRQPPIEELQICLAGVLLRARQRLLPTPVQW